MSVYIIHDKHAQFFSFQSRLISRNAQKKTAALLISRRFSPYKKRIDIQRGNGLLIRSNIWNLVRNAHATSAPLCDNTVTVILQWSSERGRGVRQYIGKCASACFPATTPLLLLLVLSLYRQAEPVRAGAFEFNEWGIARADIQWKRERGKNRRRWICR